MNKNKKVKEFYFSLKKIEFQGFCTKFKVEMMKNELRNERNLLFFCTMSCTVSGGDRPFIRGKFFITLHYCAFFSESFYILFDIASLNEMMYDTSPFLLLNLSSVLSCTIVTEKP